MSMSWLVEVNREELLGKIQINRENHKDIVSKALDGYRKAVIEVLDDMIQTIKDGGKINTYISLPRPEDHSDDYDTIIGMLTMSTQDTVSLGPEEYRSYVEDKWDWKDRFAASTAAYV